jgi:1-acyl-sn-glycerol-3-phosphate acyltransferase
MRAIFATTSIILLTLVLAPFQIAAVILGSGLARQIPFLYHQVSCWLIGLEVTAVGQPVKDQPVLFIVNHVSWLDIPVLSKLLKVSFVAKKEVASWPGFGHLAKLQRSIFIDRTRRSQTSHHNRALERRLAEGDSLILFPEGTSSDGRRVLPFKTALFGVAEQAQAAAHKLGKAELVIQPVTIRYTGIGGMPLARAQRPLLGWYGDMAMAPHFWQAVGLGHISVDVVFHEAVSGSRFASRKELAQYCFDQVSSGLQAAPQS